MGSPAPTEIKYRINIALFALLLIHEEYQSNYLYRPDQGQSDGRVALPHRTEAGASAAT